MVFMEGAPPERIFDNGNGGFAISIRVENLGEQDIDAGEGYIEITGIDPREFGADNQEGLTQDLPNDIKGVVKNSQGIVLIGAQDVVTFEDLLFEPNIRGNRDRRIRANLCYNYETEATTAVCVKRDLLANANTKEICELTGEKVVYNSGAPIQVTKAYQTPAGEEKIQVSFDISHAGETNDRFYRKSTDCDDLATNPDKDIVYFELVSPESSSLQNIKCTGLKDGSDTEGEIELYNGNTRTVQCTFDTSGVDGVFETEISAKLGYRYSQFIEKTILIEDVSTGDDD